MKILLAKEQLNWATMTPFWMENTQEKQNKKQNSQQQICQELHQLVTSIWNNHLTFKGAILHATADQKISYLSHKLTRHPVLCWTFAWSLIEQIRRKQEMCAS